ncbi:MAG: JAB domain-containing protein [Bacteroidetes bacterium]|nr:JAB domain-containing protein [Bacteroidota bacterium]
MESYSKNQPIHQWAENDRPREKLLFQGARNLSEAELLAILIGSGTRECSALELGRKLLQRYDQDLHQLARLQAKEFQQIKGIGKARAVVIMAALELGRRRQLASTRKRIIIRSSKDAYNCLGPNLADLQQEEFWILLLNRANQVIGREQISKGGIAGTVVDAKLVFRACLMAGACSMILFHNHPSGNPRPSQADIDLTRKLKKGAQQLDLVVLDHLIIAGQEYTSLADEGHI